MPSHTMGQSSLFVAHWLPIPGNRGSNLDWVKILGVFKLKT